MKTHKDVIELIEQKVTEMRVKNPNGVNTLRILNEFWDNENNRLSIIELLKSKHFLVTVKFDETVVEW